MPVYEYKCNQCGEKYEQRVGFFHTSKSTKCPKCGSEKTDRLFSTFSSNTSGCGTNGRFR
jgi:putative FmdB family regulatory protein